jgi:hypothetical protein
MWRGNAVALAYYHATLIMEWQFVRQKRNTRHVLTAYMPEIMEKPEWNEILPKWFNNLDFFIAHRSNLIRKLPEHYKPMWPDVPDNLPYIWPV